MSNREEYKDWTELDHPIWGRGGREEHVHEIIGSGDFPTKIWRKGKLSIIEPCSVTFNQWELYDGNDVERFNTLEEAKDYADKLAPHSH